MKRTHLAVLAAAVMTAVLVTAGCRSDEYKKKEAEGCSACSGCGGCGGCEGCEGCGGCGGCEGCGGCGGGEGGAEAGKAERKDAQRLYASYKKWRQANSKPFLSKPHGRSMIVDYVNALADRAFVTGKRDYAPRAAICKVGTKKGKPFRIWFMEKRARGYDSKNGDWFYATLSPTGKVMNAGRVESCINCHASAQNDYVYGLPKKK